MFLTVTHIKNGSEIFIWATKRTKRWVDWLYLPSALTPELESLNKLSGLSGGSACVGSRWRLSVYTVFTPTSGDARCAGAGGSQGGRGREAPPGSNLTSRAALRAGIALLLQFPEAGGEPGQRAAKASQHGHEHNEFNTHTQKYVYVCMYVWKKRIYMSSVCLVKSNTHRLVALVILWLVFFF